MKAVVVQTDAAGAALQPGVLQDAEIAMPVCGSFDLCVAVQAVSVNPIDLKMATAKPAADAAPKRRRLKNVLCMVVLSVLLLEPSIATAKPPRIGNIPSGFLPN